MEESILTNINLANGAINIYYDTILDILTWTGDANNTTKFTNCPSGWKCAYVVEATENNSGNARDYLITPIAIFNHSTSTFFSYYGKFYRDNTDTIIFHSFISINNDKFQGTPDYTYINSYYTVVFAA